MGTKPGFSRSGEGEGDLDFEGEATMAGAAPDPGGSWTGLAGGLVTHVASSLSKTNFSHCPCLTTNRAGLSSEIAITPPSLS